MKKLSEQKAFNCSVFPRIQTEYADFQAIAGKSPYSFQVRESTEQKKKHALGEFFRTGVKEKQLSIKN